MPLIVNASCKKCDTPVFLTSCLDKNISSRCVRSIHSLLSLTIVSTILCQPRFFLQCVTRGSFGCIYHQSIQPNESYTYTKCGREDPTESWELATWVKFMAPPFWLYFSQSIFEHHNKPTWAGSCACWWKWGSICGRCRSNLGKGCQRWWPQSPPHSTHRGHCSYAVSGGRKESGGGWLMVCWLTLGTQENHPLSHLTSVFCSISQSKHVWQCWLVNPNCWSIKPVTAVKQSVFALYKHPKKKKKTARK